jgi:hypothetical protein
MGGLGMYDDCSRIESSYELEVIIIIFKLG